MMNLSERDKQFIWHPYTHIKPSEKNIPIVSGSGAYLFDERGRKYIDAISSWWTNLHGHAHPYIAKKISEQAKKLEHVLFAGFTHKPAVELAEKLLKKLPSNQKKIFYSDNGSTAVEVALKMAFQYWYNKGQKKTKVLAFKNAYHGDTFGAMSASGRSIFTEPFNDLLFEVIFVDAPIFGNEKKSLSQFKSTISNQQSAISSFIFEPLIQGTAGMVMHSSSALDKMLKICKQNNIITIADEVMTGFCRTEKFFASDYLKHKADIFCLSKGITGGAMAMGVTSCTSNIFKAFVSSDKTKTFFHGHSYTANPLACAAALASLDVLDKKETRKNVGRISKRNIEFVLEIAGMKQISHARCMGTIMAIEVKTKEKTSYTNSIRDKAYNYFINRGIIIRPLGNVIYIMPPYCISEKDLNYIYKTIVAFLKSL